ncbi:hypothetical protein [Pseudomonas petrae]|uniref:Uncharacterized protein n=1 Tax=Pseudomonas petrae TaxID=2912190 RepID=A0ABS9I219_9PSED|nr:hypothetical protein [Pseudomonas petrae]MCF7541858.1 hypothetical protein [Pseudomonas petrae]
MTTSSLCGKPDDDLSRKSWTVKDWYTHVGAWENDRGQLCFGSTIAFSAMLMQFHRVHTAPPAGDVEVLGYATRRNGKVGSWLHHSEAAARTHDSTAIDCKPAGSEIIELVDHAQVTRLTAERDGLLAETKRLDLKVSEYDYAFDSQQSELTKARELVFKLANKGSQVPGFPSQLMREARVYLAHSTPIAHNADESCGLDAEAAKVNSVISTIDPYMAPASKGGE